MNNINFDIYPDYPLNGSITGFEAYMFVTTPKFISQHKAIDQGIVIDGVKGAFPPIDWSETAERKTMLTKFNNTLKEHITNFPKPTQVACAMIDFETNGAGSKEIKDAANDLMDIFKTWCIDNNRAGACVLHSKQAGRPLHAHLLYNKKRGEHDVFQRYLLNKLNS